MDLILTYFIHVLLLSIGPCGFNEMQCCSHALTIMGGLSISVSYYLSGVYVLGFVSCCVLDYVCVWNAIGLPDSRVKCVCVCVCVCLRKEEGVGNGVCPLSHRLEAEYSTKSIIMVCNHWSHPVSIILITQLVCVIY